MRKHFFFILFILLFVFVSVLPAQKDTSGFTGKSDEEILDEAEFFFGDANYIRAIPLFEILSDRHPKEMFYKFKLGISYIYKSDEKEQSIKYLSEVYQSAPGTKDLLYYLGVAHHLNYKFDEALNYFNDYLATNPPVNKKVLVNKYIENCRNGKIMTQTKFKTEIKNLGPVINSAYSEYVPIISSDESILIFTYKGPRSKGGLMDEKLNPATDGNYYEDIFFSQKVGSEWLIPESIGDNINSKGHDASVTLSADGQKLFIFRSSAKDHGDIYMSVLDGHVWSAPEKLGPTINTKYWEGSASMSSDEQTLYFASEKPGGIGQRDIWMAKKLENGEWAEAVNLGPNINTTLNEDAPFIHSDGVTLFFSSEGHNSMGGYDIMYSSHESGEWSKPTNLDYPVNTTGDDVFYVLSADGETGYFSSERKGGLGEQDIYIVNPGIQGEKPILALIVGITSANEQPVDATIDVFIAGADKKTGTHLANSSTGKYLLSLSPGNEYKIVVKYPGMDSLIEYVNLKSMIRFIKIKKDFKLYSPEYKVQNNIKTDSANSLQANLPIQVEELQKKDKVLAEKIYQTVLKNHGDVVKDSVEYIIELGKYEDSTAFKSGGIAEMGKINSATNEEGITTFSMGPFKTLLEAEIFKYKLLSQDSSFSPTSAVTINDHGKRTLIPAYFSLEYAPNRFDPLDEKPIIRKPTPAVFDTTKLIAQKTEPLVLDTMPPIKQPDPIAKDTVKAIVQQSEPVIPDTTKFIVQKTEPIIRDTTPLVPTPKPVVRDTMPAIVYQQPKSQAPSVRKTQKQVKTNTIEERGTPFPSPIEPVENEDEFSIREIYSIREGKALRAERYLLTKKFQDKKIKNYGSKYETLNPLTSLLDEIDAYEKGFKIESIRSDNTLITLRPNHFGKRKSLVTTHTKSTFSSRTRPKPVVVKSEQTPFPQQAGTSEITRTATEPCHHDAALDFSAFAGKDLNDTTHYNKLIRLADRMCVEGLTYKVQIGAYRHPENFKYPHLAEFGPAEIKTYPNGLTRFTLKQFETLVEAEAFRQEVIKKGTRDAMISAVYNGERKLLQDLIAVNFYNKAIN